MIDSWEVSCDHEYKYVHSKRNIRTKMFLICINAELDSSCMTHAKFFAIKQMGGVCRVAREIWWMINYSLFHNINNININDLNQDQIQKYFTHKCIFYRFLPLSLAIAMYNFIYDKTFKLKNKNCEISKRSKSGRIDSRMTANT